MPEADRDEQLAVALVVELVALPLAEGGRVAAQVDGDVEDPPRAGSGPASPGPGSVWKCRPRRVPRAEREWLCWTKSTSTPSSRQASALKVSTRKPRSSPWTCGSSRTRPSSFVSSRAGISSAPAVLALVVLAVLARADRPPPPSLSRYQSTVRSIPSSKPTAAFQPSPSSFVGGERVAAVVAGAVVDVLDQRLVAPGELQDPLDDLDVRQLVGAADVVGLARLAALEHGVDRRGEVLDAEPVADLRAVAVDRQRVAGKGVEDAVSGISFSGCWRGP